MLVNNQSCIKLGEETRIIDFDLKMEDGKATIIAKGKPALFSFMGNSVKFAILNPVIDTDKNGSAFFPPQRVNGFLAYVVAWNKGESDGK